MCVCGGDLHLHMKHCLCRVSLLRHAVSIAAARANTANHAHFLVSSYWYWLILTPIQIVFLFFFFFVLHAIWMSGQDWTHFGTPFTFTLAEVISVLEIKTKPNDD